MASRTLILLSFLCWATRAYAVDLAAGPMVGHVTDRSARIWLQFPIAGEVSVTAVDLEHGQKVASLSTTLQGPMPFVCDVPMNNLEPNHSYRIEVTFEGSPVHIPGADLVVRTAPPAESEEPFTMAFGSGLAAGGRGAAPIFKSIMAVKPRMFFFLGNSGYLPAKLEGFPTTRRAAYRAICDLHDRIRREPDLQDLLRSTACYSVYGDRDFGTPDSDRSFVFAQESLLAFQRFWPNPDWGTPQNPGCYCKFEFGDVDFFLLDTRTNRDPPTTPASPPAGQAAPALTPAGARAMLGQAQLDWLEKGLKESGASFKIVAAATPLLPVDAGSTPEDSWSHFPEEQGAFLRWLAQNRIGGLVLLAGNMPFGELQHLDPAHATGPTGGGGGGGLASPLPYPLFTLGTSTLTAVPANPATTQPGFVELHPGPQSVTTDNFGTLDFGGEREHRFVTLRLRDTTGRTRLEQTVFAAQLK